MAIGATIGAGVTGCRGLPAETEEDEAFAERLIARWRGVAVDGPASAWWADTSWDVVFGVDGDFSAIAASAVGGTRKELRFQGSFEVARGEVWVREDPNLAGLWRATLDEAPPPAGEAPAPPEMGGKAELLLERVGPSREDAEHEAGRLRLRLARRFGT
jgi:hypothetical protein